MVTKSQWVAWKHDPVTKEFLIQLNEWKENRVADVFTGKTVTEREDQLAVGEVRGAEQAMRLAAEDLECQTEEEENEQS